ncbi:MAG: gfo/Idh/MocA family oxidoreductase, partial [Verrucomicrobiae bacterium]|nr:gfo/Idh/MocA family oxidoreductase [Verrucomicrobiae bacterium]
MINIAVIGYGYWGPNLLRNFHEADGARVVMCCDQSEPQLTKARRRHPTVGTTTRFDVVLADPAIHA